MSGDAVESASPADTLLKDQQFDEIIISTLPVGVSRWLRLDVPHRVKRAFHLPCTVVTARNEPIA